MNSQRNTEIVRRRLAAEWPTDIAKAMGLSRNLVIGVCWRRGLSIAGAEKVATRAKVAKLSLDQAKEAKRRYWEGETATNIIAMMGLSVTPSNIWHLAHGEYWKDA